MKTTIVPLLQKYHLNVIEEKSNFFEFESSCFNLVIGRSSRDIVNIFTVVLKDGTICPISDDAVNTVFGLDLKIEKAPIERLVYNLNLFFTETGEKLLLCDVTVMNELKLFVAFQNDIYRNEMTRSQILIQLNDAWEKRKYSGFIKIMDENPELTLPESFQAKYRIAKRKEIG